MNFYLEFYTLINIKILKIAQITFEEESSKRI